MARTSRRRFTAGTAVLQRFQHALLVRVESMTATQVIEGRATMPRRKRICRTMRWSGVVLCALSAGSWGVNLRWIPSIAGPRFTVFVAEGGIWSFGPGRTCKETNPPQLSLDIDRYIPSRYFSWPRFDGPDYEDGELLTAWVIFLPLWVPFLLGVLLAVTCTWRRRRSKPLGHCRTCGYNLEGNMSGICPECGSRIPMRVLTDGQS